MSKICSVEEAISLIKSNDLIVSDGFVLAGTAECVLKAIEKKFLETGEPRNLTGVFTASQGNGAGMGYDHLAHKGLLKRIIGGHFGLTPGIMKMISNGDFEAYNFPMGVMASLYRAAVKQIPGELTKVGLKTFVDPRLQGGKMNSKTIEDLVELVQLKGEEYLFYKRPKIDVAIIRGTTADENGNVSIEHEAAPLNMKLIAMATKACGGKVIVQVKNIAQAGSMLADKTHIAGIYIDAVVLANEPEREHRQTVGSFYEQSMSAHVNVPLNKIEPLPLNERKILARRASMELVPNAVVNLGIGIPEGVAVVAAEEGIGDQLILTTESGIVGGIPCGGGDFGAGQNALSVVEMLTQFDFYDGGGLDLTVLGMAEINPKGDVNVSKFGPKAPGCGGFINISQNTKNVVYCGTFTAGGLKLKVGEGKLEILQEGKNKKFKKEIEQITYSGEIGYKTGQNVLYVTERAVFKLTKKGLELIEIAPGVDLNKDILEQMEFVPEISKNLMLMNQGIFSDEIYGLKELVMSKK